MVNPIVVGELDSNDEWITEKENLALPTSFSWLDAEVLNVGAASNGRVNPYT